MPAIDYKSALGNPTSIDHANIEIQGMRVSKTVKMALFTTNENAVKAGDYLLAKESYPSARVRLVVNRDLFKLQPGDPFVLRLPKYGIVQMVCRIVNIEEEDVESEKITINAMEEYTNATELITVYNEPPSYRKRKPYRGVEDIENAKILELPYSFYNSETLEVAFLVPRQTGHELGYTIYMSLDGEEYYRYKSGGVFSVYGELAEAYPITSTIDDDIGMLLDFDSAQNTDALQTISRTELLGQRNASVLDDELISFQTVTPITEEQFRLTGVYRGRWGSVMTTHSIGAPFYYPPTIVPYSSNYFVVGSTLYFKILPYSADSSMSLSDCTVYQHTFEGESYKPYEVINLKANGEHYNPRYNEEGIVLTWTPRVRGEGTGYGVPDETVDSEMTHEGKFRVRVYVSGVDVRTVEDLEVYTWTYTTSMNLADNTSYPNSIRFDVTNYIVGNNNYEFESDPTSITVRSLYPSTTTTTTTSTTTTSTTTTT